MTREQADKLIAACDYSGRDWVSLEVALERCGLDHLYGELVADILPYNVSWWEKQPGRMFSHVKARIEGCVNPCAVQ